VSVPPPVTSRRTALGGALAGIVALTGCDLDRGSEEPRSQQTTTAPPVDADADLVEQVLRWLAQISATVATLGDDHPRIRPATRPFARLHDRHAAALGGYPDGTVETLTPVGSPMRTLRQEEERLQRRLTDAAVDAESGALAKLLASMAAAVAQHLAALS
jgi:hypothetical protein